MTNVFLNHFYVNVDSQTYSAIDQDEFLKSQFAAFEKRTTVRTDKTYTGSYFYGVDTYFEFFDAGEQLPGASGIAFGVEDPGSLQKLQNQLKNTMETQMHAITRRWNEVDHPWFGMLAPAKSSELSIWVMEYDPQFLKQWHPEVRTPSDAISRAAILSRYKGVLPEVPVDPLLQNVTGLTVAADPESRTVLEQFCSTMGYKKEGNNWNGPGITFRMIDATEQYRGITEAEFALRRDPSDRKTRQIGRSRLVFSGEKRATWYFVEKGSSGK